jgi:hypothetical protein
MSGQPYRYATDPAKYRQEYLNILGIRADVDAMNLEANKVYKSTGQLPPQSQMADTRTTAEIYADVQKLKLGIIRDLAPIAEQQFASQIVETLYSSPLNSNNKLIIFLAQRAPEIAANLKKSYSFKIKGDINDANVFVQFIEDMYNRAKSSFASVESYFNRTGSEVDRGINVNDMNKVKEALEKAQMRINALHITKLSPATRAHYGDSIRAALERISQLIDVFPSTESMLKYDSYGLQVSQNVAGADTYTNHLRELHNIIKEELPRADTLSSIILHMEKFIENEDTSEFDEVFVRLMGYLPDERTIDLVRQIRAFLKADLKRLLRRGDIEQIEDMPIRLPANQRAIDLVNPAGRPARTPPVQGVEGTGLKSTITESDINFSGVQRPIKYTANDTTVPSKRPRGRPRGSGISIPFNDRVDRTRGIQPDKRYISFGRYLINNKKLNDDIVALKTQTGNSLIGYPSTRVSKNLSNVIKKIVGGNVPTFNELSELTDQERHYLHTVSRKADIEDKFSIPAPSKDKLEKDIHQFEVMRGEIMAGNDNKDLIKNFKILLLRLSKTGTIPKRDVQDIMEELLTLGY